MLETQTKEVDRLHRRLDEEKLERSATANELREAHAALQFRIDAEFKDVTTAGLSREAWGVMCFAVGLVLGTVGNVTG
jgi:hypothetical protein